MAAAKPASLTSAPQGYADWLIDLKGRIHSAQQRATLAVNRELVWLYWQIGRDILARQAEQGWGAKVIDRLAHDLRAAFPDMKGFSPRNLKYMRAFAEAWPDAEIVQQAAAQLPWGHNLVLLDRLKQPAERLAYARAAIEHGWSRNVLNIHIETRLLERRGNAVTNFEQRLPAPQSDLAIESLKDPYRFDFLGLGEEAQEREIENALVQHVTDFLLELGAGFAFVGRELAHHPPALSPAARKKFASSTLSTRFSVSTSAADNPFSASSKNAARLGSASFTTACPAAVSVAFVSRLS